MKKENFKNAYQFKVLLEGAKPPIWRRIQVPENFNFEDLHKTIQLAMGWCDCHLHQFINVDPSQNYGNRKFIKIPHPDDFDFGSEKTFDERKEKIFDWFFLDKDGKSKMKYEYDFGDGWEHMVTLEKILSEEKGVKYPRVVKGKGACPPENVGGIWGYMDIVEAMKNPKSKESQKFFQEIYGSFKEFKDWMEEFACVDLGEFDPEKYEIEDDGFLELKGYIGMNDYIGE
ncbi:plasmid pRiA4b ORF-3 family protein [Patescibacteria group bacterium]|nr:plasmid pRiA4b ORF-3 family protein [Patescibacteria group bacterium]MCG2695006.1 plasmid pRiA4b ORF-3 family protein [Candidatus Parcubacteria bacterium]